MTRAQFLKASKAVAFLYVAAFLILNWNDVSWIFNYKEVAGLLDGFFNPYPGIDATAIDSMYFYPNHPTQENPKDVAAAKTQTAVKEVKTSYTQKQNMLELPSLGLEMPIIFAASQNKDEIMKELDKGAVYYPGSVYPGQNGQIVILGHSAPPNWPRVRHDWEFSYLDKLKEGDKILIDLNNSQYTYIVKKTTVVARGTDVSMQNNLEGSNLTLVSCWPPGKDYQRIAVSAVLAD